MSKHVNEIKWDKLDNTAHLFPVIAEDSMSNVYRLSVTLHEKIKPGYLQEALDKVLPWFDVFRVRIRKGIFWYYFEDNKKPAPRVFEESTYPNSYIVPQENRSYLFRVSYYKNRINLEVFHVLTDGMGAVNFLREITYQYLRISHPELLEKVSDTLCSDTSLNKEDSYMKNYKRSYAKEYHTQRAYLIDGEKMNAMEIGIIHGYFAVDELKAVCKKYGLSINEYLVSVYTWSIYQECIHGGISKRPISMAVPVNLRPYYNSITTKNFFAVVSAVFHPDKENYTFEEVAQKVAESLRSQINREHLEKIFAYNVSNEKNLILRAVPLFLKNIAIKLVYKQSARGNSTTVTNIGSIQVREEYQPYIDKFHLLLSMSKGHNIKGAICSYGGTLVFTFSSILKDTSIQRCFFQKLAADGVEVQVETNGVYDEKM